MLSENEVWAEMQCKHVELAAAVHDAGHEMAGRHIVGGKAGK